MPSEPETTATPIEAVLASLRMWLFRVIALLADHLPLSRQDHRDLRVYLRTFESDLKCAIYIRAVAGMSPPGSPNRHHPAPGYARRRRKLSALRYITHGVFNRVPRVLHDRIAHLRAILDDIELWTARMLKRLLRGFNGDWRILAAPPVARTAPHAPTRIPALCDSS